MALLHAQCTRFQSGRNISKLTKWISCLFSQKIFLLIFASIISPYPKNVSPNTTSVEQFPQSSRIWCATFRQHLRTRAAAGDPFHFFTLIMNCFRDLYRWSSLTCPSYILVNEKWFRSFLETGVSWLCLQNDVRWQEQDGTRGWLCAWVLCKKKKGVLTLIESCLLLYPP